MSAWVPRCGVAGLAALGVAAVVARRVGARYVLATVRGDSMAPTLRDGQRVRARRAPGSACRVGDVILFAVDARDRPGEPDHRVKRVAAQAGDPAPAWMGAPAGARVPAGALAVHGDNPRSETSLHLGYVAHDAIVGVVR